MLLLLPSVNAVPVDAVDVLVDVVPVDVLVDVVPPSTGTGRSALVSKSCNMVAIWSAEETRSGFSVRRVRTELYISENDTSTDVTIFWVEGMYTL